MVEILAASVGALIGIAGITASSRSNANRSQHEQFVRLTIAVENLETQIENLHQDMRDDGRSLKDDRAMMFRILNEHGNRITALESKAD